MARLLSFIAIVAVVAAGVGGCQPPQGGSTTGPTAATRIPAEPVLNEVPLGAPPGSQINAAFVKNPYANDPAAVEEGKSLFGAMNCVYCHGGEAAGLMGPSLNGPGWRYGDSPVQIYNSIHDGRPKGMPAWGERLPPSQIWKLVAYIEDLNHHEHPSTTGPEPADQVQADTAHQALAASKTGGR